MIHSYNLLVCGFVAAAQLVVSFSGEEIADEHARVPMSECQSADHINGAMISEGLLSWQNITIMVVWTDRGTFKPNPMELFARWCEILRWPDDSMTVLPDLTK